MINFLQNLREKKKYLFKIGQCIEQQTARIRICYSQLWTIQERQPKKSHSQILGYNGHPIKCHNCTKPNIPTKFSADSIHTLFLLFTGKIIDQVVIIVAKHSKTAYRIISEHLHCTVCHQIPLLGFRSLPDPNLGEFNITVSQNRFSFYLHNASINRTYYRLSRHQ